MTGKSSGIVRCHYGVSSLAAMATVGLEVFEKAEEIFGTDIGFRQTGYVVGVGEPNVDSMRKSLAAQRAVGVQTEEIDRVRGGAHVAVRRSVAVRRLRLGGARRLRRRLQDGQAFAVSARAAGGRIRQGTTVTELSHRRRRVTGVRHADGNEISAGTVVVATGVWTRPYLASYGINVPIQVHREQIVMVVPRHRSRFRFRSSPTWCRCST